MFELGCRGFDRKLRIPRPHGIDARIEFGDEAGTQTAVFQFLVERFFDGIATDHGMHGQAANAEADGVGGHILELSEITLHRHEREIDVEIARRGFGQFDGALDALAHRIDRAEAVDVLELLRLQRVERDGEASQPRMHESGELVLGQGGERGDEFDARAGRGGQLRRFDDVRIVRRLARIVEANDVRRVQLADEFAVEAEVQMQSGAAQQLARTEHAIERAARGQLDPEDARQRCGARGESVVACHVHAALRKVRAGVFQ